jgi:ankyrin repeat protein
MYAAKYLVEKGIDVNAADKNGNTPLMLASALGEVDMINLLIENGANVNAKNKDGETALSIAKAFGQFMAASALQKLGAV